MHDLLDQSIVVSPEPDRASPHIRSKKHFAPGSLALILTLVLIAFSLMWLSAPAAQASVSLKPVTDRLPLIPLATTWTVTSTANSGSGSLRAAIAAASNGDTINFSLPANSIITLSGELVVNKAVTIDGSTAPGLRISGNNSIRVFRISATVTLKVLTIENGLAGDFDGGGGAILNTGALTIINSTITGNQADFWASCCGAGIRNTGALTVTNSTFSNNVAYDSGGAIYNNGRLVVTNSTFAGNTADHDAGGGIFNDSTGILTVTNSTFSGNTGLPSSIGNNNAVSAVTVRNTLFANNFFRDECGSITADASNIADDASCGSATQHTFAEIKLGPLANNGGNTLTFALLPGSMAIDAGSDAACPATDQLGLTRPVGEHCDVGAYEFVGLAGLTNDSPTLLGNATTFTATTKFTGPVTLTWDFGDGSATDTGNPVVHTYGAVGVYTAIVTATGEGVFVATSQASVYNCAPPMVVTTNDDGGGSLRYAISCASPGDTITFDPALADQTIVLTTGAIGIDKDLVIDGSNAPGLSISGNNASRVFYISAGAIVLNAMTIQNGYGWLVGGGIYNNGILTVTNSTFTGNYAINDGGGIYNNNWLTVANSAFNGNVAHAAEGGGIYNKSWLMITNSIFNGNQSYQEGTGLFNSGALTVINTTFAGNVSEYGTGGGIFNETTGILTVTNSTFSGGNVAPWGGNSIDNHGVALVRNTVFANNGSECLGSMNADVSNLADDGSCSSATQRTVAEIGLGPLDDYGGSTLTFALSPKSAALDAGDDTVCPATDQRGSARPIGLHCDVGAYEAPIFQQVYLPLALKNH